MRYPYRVFVGYSHQDEVLVRELVKILRHLRLEPILDAQLKAGPEFPPQLLNLITNCHVFMPVLTRHSTASPWLNQEIGFALAMGKPILPLALPVKPEGFVSSRHAVILREDMSDAAEKLAFEDIETVVSYDRISRVKYEGTDDNSNRALMLAEYADNAWKLGGPALVRQCASLTTFHLPILPATSPVWDQYFTGHGEQVLFKALRDERDALGRHAARKGCHLIIDRVEVLDRVYERFGKESTTARIKGLLSFLNDETQKDVAIALNDDSRRISSLTIVGDWFCSEAVTSTISGTRNKGLRESLFTTDQRKVRQEVDDFDRYMAHLLTLACWTPENSRREVIAYLSANIPR
jgi:hypothetical protein